MGSLKVIYKLKGQTENKWRDKTFKGAIYNKPHIQTWSGLKKEEIAAKQLEYDQMIEKN